MMSSSLKKIVAYIFATLNRSKMQLMIFFTISTAFVTMYIALFPTIREQSEELTKVLETFPKEFTETFRIEGQATFENLEKFVGIEFMSLIWPLLTIVYAISLGASAVAGEVEAKTLKFYLALPFSRLELFAAKYLSGFTQLSIFLAASLLIIKPIAVILNLDLDINSLLLLTVLGWLFGITLYSFTFLLSTASTNKGVVSAVVAGLVATMYVINILATLNDKLDLLKYFSIFYYFDYAGVLNNTVISNSSLVIFTCIILASIGISARFFNKKDFAV